MPSSDSSTYSSLGDNLAQKFPDVHSDFIDLVDEAAALARFLELKEDPSLEEVLENEELFIKLALIKYWKIKTMIEKYQQKLKDKLDGEN